MPETPPLTLGELNDVIVTIPSGPRRLSSRTTRLLTDDASRFIRHVTGLPTAPPTTPVSDLHSLIVVVGARNGPPPTERRTALLADDVDRALLLLEDLERNVEDREPAA